MDIHQMFEDAESEFLKFDRIPEAERRHVRPDLCAFLYLHERFPKKNRIGKHSDMVSGAEHDQIWLDYGEGDLEGLTQDDVVYINRCGVRWDSAVDSLCMFA